VRHIYGCLFESSQSGQTCFDPLLFHFPTVDEVFSQTENSFIVGDALLVCPVLDAGLSKYQSFFPNDKNGTYVSLKNFA
jgi:alpha-glucosidase (family GH31 glycosyl hydrolase)